MNSPFISFILKAISKSSRFLYRDYFELELQQSSKSNMNDFVQKSYNKCENILNEELAKYGDKASFEIIPLEGRENFQHALPFFAVIVVGYKQNDTIPAAVLVDFPVLGETYFSEKGSGMWLERHNRSSGTSSAIRLRVSKRVEHTLCISDQPKNIFNNSIIRNFGSVAYSICMVAAGKADIAQFNDIDPILLKTAKLFIQEAGGKIISENPLILSNGCSNIPEKLVV
jgi:myo-inositol-1(or 4)-monophosphatase